MLLGLLALAGGSWFLARPQTPPPVRAAEVLLAAPEPTPAFARALEPRPFAFPQDHGPHFDFQTEWWYYTGNLTTEDGRRFGYQLTFFRRGLTPGLLERESDLATNQVYFAHFALTDVQAGAHRAYERFSRGAAGLAGAQASPLRVWLESWSMEALDVRGEVVRLRASAEDRAIDLTLRAAKPVAAHGQAGLSPKSEAPGNASYYLSFTRMLTQGQVRLRGEGLAVAGESWFDHEWSTSALGEGAVGWDWFGLQLEDGTEVMFFQIRREDGSLEPVSGGSVILPDGRVRTFTAEEASLEALGRWASPETGVVYPSGWRLKVPSFRLDLTVEPVVRDQENRLSFVYWEGAVSVRGVHAGRGGSGGGFGGLTGYGPCMQGGV